MERSHWLCINLGHWLGDSAFRRVDDNKGIGMSGFDPTAESGSEEEKLLGTLAQEELENITGNVGKLVGRIKFPLHPPVLATLLNPKRRQRKGTLPDFDPNGDKTIRVAVNKRLKAHLAASSHTDAKGQFEGAVKAKLDKVLRSNN